MYAVPQCGDLYLTTECGKIHLKPNEVCVIPRGHKFSVALAHGTETTGAAAKVEPVRGYVCEVFNGHFKIPDLGPIGSNGLANPKDFQVPGTSLSLLCFAVLSSVCCNQLKC